jgi:hypothetical protein
MGAHHGAIPGGAREDAVRRHSPTKAETHKVEEQYVASCLSPVG